MSKSFLTTNPDTESTIQDHPVLCVSPWQILNELMERLQQSNLLLQNIRSTMNAIRESLRADVVFCQPPRNGHLIVMGDPRFPATACEAFLPRLLTQIDPKACTSLWSLREGEKPSPGHPCSAVLMRLGSTNTTWLVAVSLDPNHLFQRSDLEMLNLARNLLLARDQQSKLTSRLRDSLSGLIRCLTATLDARDTYTAGHSERVARIGQLLAKKLGLSPRNVNTVFLAGLLHDLGKIGVPDRVLMKSGSLTRKEYVIIQQHTLTGDHILSNVQQLDHVRPGVRHHHERYDGKGYPDGLMGEEIPLVGRILAVADSCDAMMCSRRYRPALTPPQIDSLFQQGSGKQWDPTIVECFMSCRKEIYPPIYCKGIQSSEFDVVAPVGEQQLEGSSMFYKAFSSDTPSIPDYEG